MPYKAILVFSYTLGGRLILSSWNGKLIKFHVILWKWKTKDSMLSIYTHEYDEYMLTYIRMTLFI
jgi:hypothetical protein